MYLLLSVIYMHIIHVYAVCGGGSPSCRACPKNSGTVRLRYLVCKNVLSLFLLLLFARIHKLLFQRLLPMHSHKNRLRIATANEPFYSQTLFNLYFKDMEKRCIGHDSR